MQASVLFPLAAMLAVLTNASLSVMTVAVLAPVAAPDIGTEATRIGVYTAIVYLFGTLSGAVTGPLVSRFGAIRVCQATMLLCAAGMAMLAQSTLAWAFLSAVVLGCAYGPFNPASAHVLWQLATPRWRPFVFSVKQTGVPLGGMLAGALIPPLVLLADWQTSAWAVGGAGLVMMIALAPLRARFDVGLTRGEPLNLRRLLAPVKLALGEPRLRRYSLTAFTYAGCQLSVATFTVVYLTDAVAMSLVTAGTVFACVQAGGFGGRLLWGMVAARMLTPKATLVTIGSITAACIVLFACVTPAWPLWLVLVLATVLGATSFGWNGVMLSEIATHAPEGEAIAATAGMQVVMFGGITVFPPLFGALVGWSGSYAVALVLTAALGGAGVALLASLPRE